MTNITYLTLSDITVKNCKCDRHMNATIVIKDCINVQWTKITVVLMASLALMYWVTHVSLTLRATC